MCTVTYLPQSGENFILTSNRDENAARSPQHLTQDWVQGTGLIFPRDTSAGGTWIAASDDGRVGCLLNGAFEKHNHRPPYRRSRGLMVLDSFAFPSAAFFAKNYEFAGMEPFTYVMAGPGELSELRWDENQVHYRRLDAQGRYIWSSATLYPPEVGAMRAGWFRDWQVGRQDFSLPAIQDFHRHGGEADEWNGFVMNRNNIVQTVSITSVVRSGTRMEIHYNDLLRKTTKQLSIGWFYGRNG